MAKYTELTVDYITFELNTKEVYTRRYIGNEGSIFDAYERPSRIKMEIYDEWLRWFQNNCGNCAVSSHNRNFFTIRGFFEDKEGNLYVAWITPSHNYAWRIEE